MATLRRRPDRGNKFELLHICPVTGKRYRTLIPSTDPKIANLYLRKAEDLIAQAKLGLIPEVGRIDADVVAGRKEQQQSPTLKEFQARYEERCRYDLEVAEGTISLNNLAFKSFIGVVGNLRIGEVTDDHLIRWKRAMIEEGKTATTIRIYFAHLKAAFNRAAKNRLIKESPFNQVAMPRLEEAEDPKNMSYEEVQKVLKVIDADLPRFGIYVRFLLYTGCRRGEILNLQWENIDLEKGVVEVYSQKIRKRLALPINKALRRVIEKMERKEEGFVFLTDSASRGAKAKKQSWNKDWVTHKFSGYLSDAGLGDAGYSLHSLRHTYSTYLTQRGVPLEIVQRLLGHSSVHTTRKHYDHAVALHFRAQADLVDFDGDENNT